MRDINDIVASFRKAGSKITPQRLAIFKLLKDNVAHPSAEDIYREILKIHPSISFTTVYKTLQTLRDMGEIQELSVDPERAHYDPTVEDHAHAFCTRCRKIEDLDGVAAPDHRHSPSAWNGPRGFDVQNVQVSVIGICEDCR